MGWVQVGSCGHQPTFIDEDQEDPAGGPGMQFLEAMIMREMWRYIQEVLELFGPKTPWYSLVTNLIVDDCLF